MTSTFFAVEGLVDTASLTLSEHGDAELRATYFTALPFSESRFGGLASLAADFAFFLDAFSIFS